MPRILTPDAARQLVHDVLVANATTPANAWHVARALVAAEVDGIGSHGLSRLPAYADQARSGKVDGGAEPSLTLTAAGAVRIDARCGFAFPAIDLAIETAAGLTPKAGVCGVAIANSHHCGVAGHHVERLAALGYVALMFANTPAAMAPWGGATASFGTNPIAFATPRGTGEQPLVIDLSLSKVARGRIMVAGQKGEAIDPGWALDVEGRPTTSADAALAGTMVPLGDAKGAALALMVEILAATLTGSLHAYEASSFFEGKGPSPRVGQFILAIDPTSFGGAGYANRLEDLIAHVTGQPGTRLPGDRRLAARRERSALGISVDDALMIEIETRLRS